MTSPKSESKLQMVPRSFGRMQPVQAHRCAGHLDRIAVPNVRDPSNQVVARRYSSLQAAAVVWARRGRAMRILSSHVYGKLVNSVLNL